MRSDAKQGELALDAPDNVITLRLAAGKTTERDRMQYAAAACLAAWRQAA